MCNIYLYNLKNKKRDKLFNKKTIKIAYKTSNNAIKKINATNRNKYILKHELCKIECYVWNTFLQGNNKNYKNCFLQQTKIAYKNKVCRKLIKKHIQ